MHYILICVALCFFLSCVKIGVAWTVLWGLSFLDNLVASVAIRDAVNRPHRFNFTRLHKPSVLSKDIFVFLRILKELPILLLNGLCNTNLHLLAECVHYSTLQRSALRRLGRGFLVPVLH